MRFNKLTLLFGIMFATSFNITAQNTDTTTLPGKWQLVWSDEFNEKSIDTSVWNICLKPLCGIADCTNRPENIRVENGNLVIEVKKEQYKSYQYTTGAITTQNKRSFLYGKFEMRTKLPRGSAIWPAFWTLGDNHKWPKGGEIDIFELWGGNFSNTISKDLDNKIWSTFHWLDSAGVHKWTECSYTLPSGIFNDEYHIFCLEWNASNLYFSLDGNRYCTLAIVPAFYEALHQKHYILIDLAIQADQPGYVIDDSILPQKLYVDWVRVSQWKSDTK